MKVHGIAFVHYPVTDKQRARNFYEGVLGLAYESGHDFPDGFWLEYAVGDSTIALSNFWKPATEARGPMVALEVADFGEAVVKLKAARATFTLQPHETPVCHQAVVLDPDGNSVMIHQRKPGPRG